ncbi:MAG: hypothetical protein IKO16_02075 [Lachnospiraceae bacterium]|nr:hypothetical protein [Lachnospiraceae bacterium]
MSAKRRIAVHVLLAISFFILIALPMMALSAVNTSADSTPEEAAVHTGDYVFFIVENNDVPLAAAPTVESSAYILWICLASTMIMILFVYSAWYFSVQKNIRELSGRLRPSERRSFFIPQSFFHPVRFYQLSREVEDTVASIYNHYI